MNPIKYSELIYNDTGGFKDLADELAKVSTNYNAIAKSVEAHKEKIREGLQAANPATPEGQSLLNQYAASILELEKKVKTLEDALKNYKQTQKEIAALDAESIRRKIEHKEKVKELTDKVKEYVAEQRLSESTLDQLARKEQVQQMSYNQLSQAYTQLKNKINEMTAATEDEIKARERLSAIARGVYEQMNTLQQETGKYTLQVGNYAKSWNGLHVAMQQIIRETPNLAMGFNTFFLAISNNIPILSDQIKLARDKYNADLANIAALKAAGAAESELAAAQKAAIPVGKQLLTSFLSWQTAMVAGVALLTMFGGKLIKAASGWIKMKRGIDDAKVSMQAFNNAVEVGLKAGAEETAKLTVLYNAATDLNLAMNDRLDAIKSLKNLWPSVFGGLSNEAILVGNAKAAYDDLAKSLFKVAQAQAAMNLLTEIAGKKIQAQADINTAQSIAEGVGYSSIDDLYVAQQKNNLIWNMRKLSQTDRQAFRKGRKAQATLAELEAQEKGIIAALSVDDLFGSLTNGNGGGGAAKGPADIQDYFYEAFNAMIDGMVDGLGKNRMKLFSQFDQTKHEIASRIEELQKIVSGETDGDKTEAQKQIDILGIELETLEENYRNADKKLVQDMLDSYEEAVTDEDDLLEIEKKKIDTRLKVEKELRDYYIYRAVAEGKMTQEEVDKALTKSSNDYWKAYAGQLLGLGDVAGYNDAMSHVKGEKDEKSKLEEWLEKKGITRKYLKDLERAAKLTIGYISDIIDAYHELAKAAVEAAQKQVDAAQKVYEAELGAYENGYANNVEYARKELALRKQQLAEAHAQELKYQKMQQAAESASQAVTLVSTIAYLFRDAVKAGGLIGIPLAIAASATMLAAFTASKIMVAKATRAQGDIQYGEGMHEYLDYGGSHASGNDIDFGTTRDGRRRRVEKGEMIAVFNKKNTDKYGSSALGNLVDSINHGTFERDYLGVFVNGADGNGVIIMNNFPSSVSDDISAIRKSTESQRYMAGNGTIIEKYRNRTRIIHLN